MTLPKKKKIKKPKNKSPRRPSGDKYRNWRKACIERDKKRCVKCLRTARRLVVHHILSYARYPDERYSVENGATLCRACHQTFHMIYGLHKFTKENFDEFLASQGRLHDKRPGDEPPAV